MEQALESADLVLAPELMLTEVANALWRLQRAGQLEAGGLQQRLDRRLEREQQRLILRTHGRSAPGRRRRLSRRPQAL
jgi:predicted nucleic acid-binding protein